MLKPEEINGKMYQPVEGNGTDDDCDKCVFNGNCKSCMVAPCSPRVSQNSLYIYYINIEGE